MRSSNGLIGGAILGLIAIILGAVALGTPKWLSVSPATMPSTILTTISLLNCDDADRQKQCPSTDVFKAAKGLEVAGVALIFVSFIVVVIVQIAFNRRVIRLIPVIILAIGPTLILIGLVLYAKSALEALSGGTTKVNVEYSLVLMVVACIAGFFTAIYFSYTAGYHRHTETIIETRPKYPDTALF